MQLEAEFIQRLAQFPSNIPAFQNGAEIYRQLVIPAQISLPQVVADYAIHSLCTPYPQRQQVYCYIAQQQDYQLQRLGTLTITVGHLQLVSEITCESANLAFALLHLGGWDFHCCIQPFAGRRHYSELKAALACCKVASQCCKDNLSDERDLWCSVLWPTQLVRRRTPANHASASAGNLKLP